MSPADRSVIMIIVTAILIHITIWLIGYFTHRLSVILPFANLALAGGILIYWLISEVLIKQNNPELRELVFIFFVFIIAGSALYKILSSGNIKWLNILQYIIFVIDTLLLISALIFMFSFKITRLF